MPRFARLDIAGLLQHVMVRDIESDDIFIYDHDRQRFVDRFASLLSETGVRCYAWTFLSNHFHALMMPTSTPLSSFLRRLLKVDLPLSPGHPAAKEVEAEMGHGQAGRLGRSTDTAKHRLGARQQFGKGKGLDKIVVAPRGVLGSINPDDRRERPRPGRCDGG
jgi:REP element-mobilizing transposase RayT